MAEHFVLVNEAGVYVKEGQFFRNQGGITEPWGKNWERIYAKNLYDARRWGIAKRRARFPKAHRTLGEDEPMEVVWPEAKGQ